MRAVKRVAVRTSSVDEAAVQLLRAYPSQTVSTERGRDPFAFSYRSLVTDRFSISRVRCTGVISVSGSLPDAVNVGRHIAGSSTLRCGAQIIDTSRPYLYPAAPAKFELTDGDAILISLLPAGLTEYLHRSGDGGVLVNRLPSTPHLTALGLVIDRAAAYLEDFPILTGAAQDELHDLLCWALLHAFEDPWAETRRAGVHSAALKRALRYLDEHADEPVTMPEVAEAAQMSCRSLATLFHRELDTTPHQWLRDRRLDRARTDLLAGAGPVAQIAARHGLLHPGRFALHYLQRFGEHPRQTLHDATTLAR